MDNQEFDKLFSDRLQEEQNFSFEESDWEEVSDRIRSKSKRRRFFWWFWGLGLLLISTVGLLAYFYDQLSSAHTTIDRLEDKISSLDVRTTVDQIIVTDTLYLKDTIFQPRFTQKKLSKNKRKTTTLFPSTNTNKLEELTIPPVSEEKNVEEFDEENVSGIEAIELLQQIPLKESPLGYLEDKERYYLENRKFIKAKKLCEDRLKIGFTSAFGITRTPNNDTLAFFQGLDNKRATFDIGLQVEWALNYRLRALGGIDFNYIRFNIPGGLNGYGQYYGNGEFVENLNISQSALHYRIGLKYVHQDYKKWTPYVGIILNAQSNQVWTTKTKYLPDFFDGQTQTAKTFDNTFRLNALESIFGFEHQLSNKFSLQIEGWYRFHFHQREAQLYSLLGIRTSFIYNF